MKVHRISAITLRIKEMERSCRFYSQVPGFRIIYGGSTNDSFSTYEIGRSKSSNSSKTYLNLEMIRRTSDQDDDDAATSRKHFGRIIFHTDDVDRLYNYFKSNKSISTDIIFETVPSDAPWGERYFHIREPDGYQLSFAKPLKNHLNNDDVRD